MKHFLVLFYTVFLTCLSSLSANDESDCREATRKGLEMVTGAASRWQQNKTCFSCHHQTLPLLAMIEASRAGFPLDRARVNSQAETTHRYFEKRIDTMVNGDHVPGSSTTVGYGFWALSLADKGADDTTAAMVAYLLQIQGVARLKGGEPSDLSRVQNGRWTTSCVRLPMQGSDIADTALCLMGMAKYVTEEQRPALARSRAAAEKWLAQAPLRTTEDRIWRLWGSRFLGEEDEDEGLLNSLRTAIASTQRDDGGWAASDGLESDAFSTGQTLFVLCRTGTSIEDPMIEAARDYLIRTQCADGSWRVESRVEDKAQAYFENGDPHGEHQFLSIAATAWSTAALAQLLPSGASPKPDAE